MIRNTGRVKNYIRLKCHILVVDRLYAIRITGHSAIIYPIIQTLVQRKSIEESHTVLANP